MQRILCTKSQTQEFSESSRWTALLLQFFHSWFFIPRHITKLLTSLFIFHLPSIFVGTKKTNEEKILHKCMQISSVAFVSFVDWSGHHEDTMNLCLLKVCFIQPLRCLLIARMWYTVHTVCVWVWVCHIQEFKRTLFSIYVFVYFHKMYRIVLQMFQYVYRKVSIQNIVRCTFYHVAHITNNLFSDVCLSKGIAAMVNKKAIWTTLFTHIVCM